MKKFISVFLIISMLLSCVAFTVPVSAKATAENIDYVEALYFENSPTIDGYISKAEWGDETFRVYVWDCATVDDHEPWYEFFYNRIGSATNRDDYSNFSYTVWLRWDLNKFYVGVKVVDPDVHSLKCGTSDTWNGDALHMRVDKHGANAATNGSDFRVTADRKKPWSSNIVPDFLFGYVEIAGGFSEAWENVSNKGMTAYSNNPLGTAECVVAPAGSNYSGDTQAGITTYEIAIPWAYIYNGEYDSLEWKQYAAGRDTNTRGPRGALGKELGMSMAVMNDGANATAGSDAFMAWGSGICEPHQTEGALAASGSNSVTLVETKVYNTGGYVTYDPTPLLDAEFNQDNIDNPGVFYDYLGGDTNKDNKVPYDELYTLTYDNESDLSVWGASEYGGKIGYTGAEHGNVLDYTDMTADNFQTYIDTRDGTVEYLFPTSYTFEFDIMYTAVEQMAEGYGSELYNWFGGASGYAYQCGYFFNDNAFKVVNTNNVNEVLSTYYYELKKDTWYNWKFQFDNESCNARLWIDDLSTEEDNYESGTMGELGYTGDWGTLVVNTSWRYFYYSTERAQDLGTLLLFRQLNVNVAYDNVKIYNFATPTTTPYMPDVGSQYDTISLNTAVEVTVTENEPDSYFQFIPEETGIYRFYSAGYEDTYGYILDENHEIINCNDDGNDQNFEIYCHLEAGKKYILRSHLYSCGSGTYTVQIENPGVATVDFYDVTVTEGFDSYIQYEYNEETDEYDLPWSVYDYSISGAVTMKDGTVEYFENNYYNENYVQRNDNQSYYSQWTAGNTYPVVVSLLGFEKVINVTVIESPIVSVRVDDMSMTFGISGYYTTDWDENGDPFEWFYYEYYPSYTVELSDGSTISAYGGEPVYVNGVDCYLSIEDSQSYSTPWGVGTHTVKASIGGATTTFTVEIKDSPIESITIDPISIPAGSHSYEFSESYGDGLTNSFLKYSDFPVMCTVKFKDGTVKTLKNNQMLEYEGSYYYITYEDDQSFDNQWGIGTHTVTAKLLGCETEFTVEITKSPIVAVYVDDINIIEYTNGYYDTYWDENGNPSEWFRYSLGSNRINYTVVLEDNSTISVPYYENGVTVDGVFYNFLAGSDQSYTNQWTIGKHTAYATIGGQKTSFNVNITTTPIVGVVFKDIELYENFSGEILQAYNPETGNYDRTYFRYNYTPECVILMNDGSVLYSKDAIVNFNGENYVIDYTDTQVEEEWGLGTHSVHVSVLGYDGTVNVTVKECPYTDIEISGTTDLFITLYKKDGTSEKLEALGFAGYNGGGILSTTGKDLYITLSFAESESGEKLYDKDLVISAGILESNSLDGNLWFEAMFTASSYEYNIDVYHMHYNTYQSEGSPISCLNSFDGKITNDNIDAVATVAVWMYDEEPWSDASKEFVTVDGVEYYLADIDFARDCIERMFGITNVDFTISDLYDPERPDKVKILWQLAGGRGGSISNLSYEKGNWIFVSAFYDDFTIIMNDDLKVTSFRIGPDDRNEVSSIEILTLPETTTYSVGSTLDIRGLTLKVKYADGTEKIISGDFTTSGFDSSSAGEKTVTVNYRGSTATFTVTVEDAELGDVDGNGTVNAMDSYLIRLILTGAYLPSDEENRRSDLNGDSIVNAMDSYILKLILAGANN